ncbi:MAG: DUF3617 domain-containing protein [Phenylobacterium sp.]
MRQVVVASLLAAGAFGSGAAWAAVPQAIQPGMWEETRKLTVLESPMMSPAMMEAMRRRPPVTSRRCITPAEVADGMKQIMDKDFRCPADIHIGAAGGFDATAVCHDEDGVAKFHFHGAYSPTSFNVSGDGVASGKMSMKVHSEMTGRLVGPCR